MKKFEEHLGKYYKLVCVYVLTRCLSVAFHDDVRLSSALYIQSPARRRMKSLMMRLVGCDLL